MSGIGGHVEIPGHEKTLNPLQKIVAEYRSASFNSNGKYSFDQKRQEAAINAIMALSQFYSARDALQMLGRAVTSAPRPATTSKPPRTAPKSP